MITALSFMLLGALVFEEQELPLVVVPQASLFPPDPACNFRQIDLDDDGAADLVFPLYECAVFQRNAGFQRDGRVDLPSSDESRLVDLWDRKIFFIYLDRIEELLWRDDHWETTSAPLTGLEEAPAHLRRRLEDPISPFAYFSGFLHDFDGDGVPEVVLPDEDGLRVFRRQQRDGQVAYEYVSVLEVFPPPDIWVRKGALWPPEKRTITIPSPKLLCDLHLDADQVVLTSFGGPPGGPRRYHIWRYHVDMASLQIAPERTTCTVTEPLPEGLVPLRLNEDDVVDFFDFETTASKRPGFYIPIIEVSVTTDLGKTLRTVRFPAALRARCALFGVDYDGDGDIDLVTETTEAFDGGVREVVTRFFSEEKVAHRVSIYFQDDKGSFSPSPDVEGRFVLDLGAPPVRAGEMLERYRHGELTDFTGDFNGDGIRDAAVQDHPNRISIYLGGMESYESRPAAQFDIDSSWRFGVTDVDSDGRSDIAVQWLVEEEMNEGDYTRLRDGRVFLTREAP